MTTDDSDIDNDRDATRPTCSQCGRRLERREPKFGVPYWACPQPHEPPEVATASRQLDYAIALVRAWIVDPDGDDRLDIFEGEGPGDPAQFVDAVCDRLAVARDTHREKERERFRSMSEDDTEDRSQSDTDDTRQDRLNSFQ